MSTLKMLLNTFKKSNLKNFEEQYAMFYKLYILQKQIKVG